MDWLTWQQGAAIAASSATASFGVQRLAISSTQDSSVATKVQSHFIAATKEIAFVSGLYTLWRLARVLPLDQSIGAIDRGRTLQNFQREIFLPSELSLQKFVLQHEWLAQLSNAYYAIAHVPVLLLFLVWLFAFHQFAAMPSIHVGWAAVVSLGVVAASTSKWRWLALFHVLATIFVVSATGNHWWLDGLVAIALLGIALLIDERFIRARRG